VSGCKAEIGGGSANDLRDQRRQALADLAGIVGVTAVEDARGVVTVSAANGLVLVTDASVVHPLAVRESGVGLDGLPLHEAGTVDATGGFLAVPGAFDRGTLAALQSTITNASNISDGEVRPGCCHRPRGCDHGMRLAPLDGRADRTP